MNEEMEVNDLIDNNKNALYVAKKVFKKYSKNFKKHRFVCSSIFDYASKNICQI